MTTRTMMRTALRGISGGVAMTIMLWLVLAAPSLVSDRDSRVPNRVQEAGR